MGKLPKIFAKKKLSIPANRRPDVIIRIEKDFFYDALDSWWDGSAGDLSIYFSSFWIEWADQAMLCWGLSADEFHYTHFFGEMPPFSDDGYFGGEDTCDTEQKNGGYQKMMACIVAIQQMVSETSERPASSKARAGTICGRIGDDYRYDNVVSLASQAGQARLSEMVEGGRSGIKLRDHAVRGHWRHHSDGRKSWVREHRRGDPSLGTVTRVIS